MIAYLEAMISMNKNWGVFFLLFAISTFTAHAQFNSKQELPDKDRQEDLSSFKKPNESRRILMVQNKSPEARQLAIKANNWRITSNIIYSIALAGGLTSVAMANHAFTEDQVGRAIGVGASSLIAAVLGFVCQSMYTHNLFKAIDVYLYPKKQNDQSELTLRLGVNLQLGN